MICCGEAGDATTQDPDSFRLRIRGRIGCEVIVLYIEGAITIVLCCLTAAERSRLDNVSKVGSTIDSSAGEGQQRWC